jgi:hypothetical protein
MEKSSRQWVLLQIVNFALYVLVVYLLHEWRQHVKKKIEVVFFFPPLADHMQSMLLIQSTSSSNGFASQLKQLHMPVASCTFLTELNATCPHELKCFKFTSNPLQENTHTHTQKPPKFALEKKL